MFFSHHLVLSTLAFTVTEALSFPEISLPGQSFFARALSSSVTKRQSGTCPSVWGDVATELRTLFLDATTAECNDDARAAVRAVFHDCGTWSLDQGDTGGCDGSFILAQEFNRAENNGLQDIAGKLQAIAQNHAVGVADLIVFAASVAVATCPLGPITTTFIGRTDSSNPAPEGKLPNIHQSGDDLFALFQDKGITAIELAALIGAHSTSRSFHQDPAGQGDAGLPQDSTPGIWDVNFYAETSNPPSGLFVFPSDIALSQHTDVGPQFASFVGRQGRWNAFFVTALTKMSLFGVPGGSSNLIDCTEFITAPSQKRDIRAAPINDRVR